MNRFIGWSLAGMAISLPGPAQLSGQNPSGSWETTFVQAVQVSGGEVADTLWATGELVLTLAGDRLTGTWEGVGAWQVEGTFADGRLRFWTTALEEGDSRLRQIERIDWEGMVEGDRMEGVQWMTMGEGGPPTPRRFPWGAERRPTGQRPIPGSLQCAKAHTTRSSSWKSRTGWYCGSTPDAACGRLAAAFEPPGRSPTEHGSGCAAGSVCGTWGPWRSGRFDTRWDVIGLQAGPGNPVPSPGTDENMVSSTHLRRPLALRELLDAPPN